MSMTDRYEKIRKALAMGPTPGPWALKDGRTDIIENAQGYPVCTVSYHPDERYCHGPRSAYIAACDPDTIQVLLEERDALVAENARLRKTLLDERDALLDECDALVAENARLREALLDERDALAAEVERLEKALKDIQKTWCKE